MSAPVILLAEDDPNLAFVIADHLAEEGYEVISAKNGLEALASFREREISICLIDVMMPRMDGFSLAREIRKLDEMVPLLFLTARSLEEDRVKGFEIGGDDYITKPFSMQELVYRVRVFLRRSLQDHTLSSQRVSTKHLPLGKLIFDEANLLISCGENKTGLTQMEADLLLLLMKNRNILVKREVILETIWGENDYFKGRSLDVFISRLRKYLKDDPTLMIKNHHGVGFTLVDRDFAG